MNEATYEQRKLALIGEISWAFDGISREGGVSYTEARMLDDYGHHASLEDRAGAREQDTERRWQDVPEDDIGLGAGYSNLSFLDPIGFRYYIPAYIVWYIRYIGDEDLSSPYSGSNAFDSIISLLTVAHWPSAKEYYLSRFELFTPEQSKAIAHFLKFEAHRQNSEDAKWELEQRKDMADRGLSQAEVDAYFGTSRGDNAAEMALASYWEQFL